MSDPRLECMQLYYQKITRLTPLPEIISYAISEKLTPITNHQNPNQNEKQKTQEKILSII